MAYDYDHPEVAMILINLGIAYGALGNAAQSKVLLEHALRIQKHHFGPNHPVVAITLNNLANAYESLTQTQQALHLQAGGNLLLSTGSTVF